MILITSRAPTVGEKVWLKFFSAGNSKMELQEKRDEERKEM